MDWGIVGGIAGIVSLVIILLAVGVWKGGNDTTVKAIDKRLSGLEERFNRFMDAIAQSARSLHSPHTGHRDALLEKVSPYTLTKAEAIELLVDLQCHKDDFKGAYSLTAHLLIALLNDKLNGDYYAHH